MKNQGSGGTKPVTPSKTYAWNERNLLKNSGETYSVQYKYGVDGQRAGKFSASPGGGQTETIYFNKMYTWRWDGLISDRAGRNSRHIFLGDIRIVTKIRRADGSFTSEEEVKQYYYHSDHLGNAQLITNAEGQEYERCEYTPYGELWVEKASAASNIDVPYRFTGKERDKETGLYYYGARYLDPKTSRWMSADPAMGEYVPGAPVNDAVKKQNQNLPGMGGVFNVVNLHLYHYAGNNPVKYTDPTGMYVINNVAEGAKSALDYVKNRRNTVHPTPNWFNPRFTTTDRPSIVTPRINQYSPRNNTGIQLPGNLNRALDTAIAAKNDNNSNTQGKITAGLTDMGDGVYGITVTAETRTVDSNGRVRTTKESGVVAYARLDEIKVHGTKGDIDYDKVGQIANETINIVRDTTASTRNIDEVK